MQTMKSLEFANIQNILDYQIAAFKKTMGYCMERSQYYRALFSNISLKTEDIKTHADLEKIPLTLKSDLQNKNSEFYCCEKRNYIDIVCTSGSTGLHPITHPLTQMDINRLALNEKLSFSCAGLCENDITLISVNLDGLFIAGFAYYLGLKEIGAKVLRSGPLDYEQQNYLLKKIPVTCIVGVPSNLIHLFEYCNKNGTDIASSKINKLVLIGETTRNNDFTLNALGRRLKEALPDATLFNTYANTEIATSFCECSEGRGGHCHPELCLPEIIDEDGVRLKPGEVGELVITTFGAHNMPLLRYRTGDITFIDDTVCSCGRNSIRLGPILYRKENMLKIHGISVYPQVINEAIRELKGIEDYILVADKDNIGSDEVAIYISTAENTDNVIEKTESHIRAKTRISAIVKTCSLEELRKLQYSSKSSKPRRFIDNRMNK